MELLVLQDATIVHRVAWTSGSLSVGRAADNDLILRDSDVSGHHALFYREGGVAHCRDLGSTNGLFHNGERVVQAALKPGDQLGIGGLVLVVAGTQTPITRTWLIRRQGDPVAVPVDSGASLEAHPEIVLFVEDGGVWIDDGDTPRPLQAGPFQLGGVTWLLEPSSDLPPTQPRQTVLPYFLEVDLESNLARLQYEGLRTVEYRAGARVSLLYVLAGNVGTWIDDRELGTGVWGREWARQGPNNLNVLIHRVRKQAEAAGFDRRFLQRRRGGLRLVVAEAITR